jgi:diadenylate cyclase
VIIVIFPEELRHLLQRIAVWSFNFKKTPPLRGEATDIIAGTSVDLAKNKTGALIVIRGIDPLERYITGGIVLNGDVSGPLLKSIFDPHSPGYDGAVVIENGRISRFRAHLPLSKDLVQTAHLGTRHRAALGLAELCDAICLVVSEERGQVSVAQNGMLEPVENLQQIVGAIDHFLQEKFPQREAKGIPYGLFRKHWIAKAIALSLAIGFWYIFVPGSRTVQVSYRIPVSVENLPADLRVEEIEPPMVNATFSGPRRAFYLFDARKIRVAIDVSMADLGRRTFNISEQNIRYPRELTLQELNPSTLRISVKKIPAATDTNRG